MIALATLLILAHEYGAVCRDSFHEELGEAHEQFMPCTVLHSAAGYYHGYFCPVCGPYDRISGYYRTRAQAEHDLEMEMRGTLEYYQDDPQYDAPMYPNDAGDACDLKHS